MTIRVRQLQNAAACSILLSIMAIPALTAAQSSKTIAQGFTADSRRGALVAGTLVSTEIDNQHKVELAATDTAKRLVGVVDKSPLVTIGAGNNEVAIVLNGTTTVLISDINGNVSAGDRIAPSPIAGVGMRASGDGQVIGTAQSALHTAGAATRTIADSDGKRHSVHIGYIPLQVGVTYYQAPGSGFLPPVIQNAANSIAGREISLIRVLICGALLLTGAVAAAILVYSSIRSAMTSIGRNPLAAGAIRRSMYQVFAVGFGIFGASVLAGYLVLRV